METLPATAFEKGRLRRDGTWVVAFYAEWCPFCRRFRPEFEALDGGTAFRTAIGDVSSEVSPLWDDFAIEVVPTVIVFRDGRPVFRVDSVEGFGPPPHALDRARAAALAATD